MNFLRATLFSFVYFLALSLSAQTTLKSPDQFLPHQLGEQFTPHHLLTDYFEYLAMAAPEVMRLERYGMTNEDRPLQIAIFSAPENIARLEQIRLNNLQLAGFNSTTSPGLPTEESIAIV